MSTPEPREEIQEIVRSDIPSLRRAMRKLGVVVAEVDRDLRYVWIDNPHPDFDPATVVGRRDDELIPAAEAAEIMAVKRSVWQRKAPLSQVLVFKRSDGSRHYSFRAYPIRDARGRIDGILTLGFDDSPPKRPTRR
jgi:hypothetical protein